jgi:hypothetical protein
MRVVRRQIDIYPPPTAGTGGGGGEIGYIKGRQTV